MNSTLPIDAPPANGYVRLPSMLVTRWSHIDLPRPMPLIKRGEVKIGMTVVSSHTGTREVTGVMVLGTEGQTTYLHLQGINGIAEAYPSDLTMPLALDEHGHLPCPPTAYCSDRPHLPTDMGATGICAKCEGPTADPR